MHRSPQALQTLGTLEPRQGSKVVVGTCGVRQAVFKALGTIIGQMRPIDVIEEPATEFVAISELQMLAEIVESIFSYQHEHEPEPPNGLSASKEEWVKFFLRADIFHNLIGAGSTAEFQYFVLRKELDELVKKVDVSKGVILLVGQAGAGKSTLIRKLRQTLAQKPKEDIGFHIPVLQFHIDFTRTKTPLHEASKLAHSPESVDQALILMHQIINEDLVEDIKRIDIEYYYKYISHLLLESDKGKAMTARMAEVLTRENATEFVKSIMESGDAEAKAQLTSLVQSAELPMLFEFAEAQHRVVVTLDNVDRWPLAFQELLLQFALDLSPFVRILISIRASNLDRIVSNGKGGNETREVILSPFNQEEFAAEVFVTRSSSLDRLRTKKLNLTQIYDYYAKHTSNAENIIKRFVDAHFHTSSTHVESLLFEVARKARELLDNCREGRLTSEMKRALENEELKAHYINMLEFLGNINLGTFSTIIKEIVSSLNSTLINEQIYNYSNNSVRHSLFFYSEWFKSVIKADDPGFWYPSFFKTSGSSIRVNERVVTNYVYKRMLVRGVKGDEPHLVPLACLFTKNEVGIVAFILRVLEAIRDCAAEKKNDYWETPPVTFGDIESHLVDKFTMREKESMIQLRDLLRSATEELQRMESYGHLGLIWCTDSHEGDVVKADALTASTRFVLTPAGHYVIDMLAQKREFAFWCYMNTHGFDIPWAGRGSQRVSYLGCCSEDFHIRAVANACTRELSKLFLDEMAEVRRRGGNGPAFVRDHLYLRILDSLKANITSSEKYQQEEDGGELHSGYHRIVEEINDSRANFMAMSAYQVAT